MRRRKGDDNGFGPDTDLAMSLLAILLCAVAFMTEKRSDLEGEVEAKQGIVQEQQARIDSERKARAATEAKLGLAQRDRQRMEDEREQQRRRGNTAERDRDAAKQQAKREATARLLAEKQRNAAKQEAKTQASERKRELDTRHRVEKERNQLRSSLANTTKSLRNANARLARSMELRLKTIDAPLIIEIQVDDVPADADADIHVQDPTNHVTGWCFKPAQDAGKQITGLIKSESLALPEGQHREAFYAASTRYEANRPYLVGCMLYADNSKLSGAAAKGTWKVTVKTWRGTQTKSGPFRMWSLGTVKTNKSFVGLHTFLTVEVRNGELSVNTDNVPSTFRGWKSDTSGVKATMTKPEKG